MLASRHADLALGLLALVLPASAQAQQSAQVRTVVSKEVSVGRTESALRLELDGGQDLTITFDDGSVLLNDESVGSFVAGGALDVAWRELLAQAVALDDGPLASALVDWTVPPALTGDAAVVAGAIDRALEGALTGTPAQVNAAEPSVTLGDARSLVRLLLDRDRLELLDDALDGVDDGARVEIGADVVIGADETVEGDLVVIEGDARIEGEVDGDVVMVGGALELLEGSVVEGSVRLADARLLRNLGEIEGDVVEVRNEAPALGEVREDIRREVVDELRAEIRQELREEIRGGAERSMLGPFRSVASAVGGVLENLVTILILGLVGAAVIAFGGDKVDVIAETVRRAPGRSAAVGAAGTILLIPVWVLGFVALVVSIVGIPVAIAWLPLFPIAACLAALVGYLSVARNAGEWLADSDLPWTQWIRKSNSLITITGGLLALMVLFVAANIVSVAPFLGFLRGLLAVAGFVVTVAALQIGFGAVILTRGGRRRDYARDAGRYSADEAWEAAMKVEVDDVVDESGSNDSTASNGKETGDA
jgi:cytoskeletal protein CcmA (bactofilin family)